jgi:prepilin-type N-terminal cleavage/methylation domain-containing protein
MRWNDTNPARVRTRRRRCGMTLVELVVVLVVLVAIAALAVSAMGFVAADAREQTTTATLTNVRNAIDARYRLNMSELPRHVADLLRTPGGADFDPATQTGWNGPYVLAPGATYTIGELLDPLPPAYVPPANWYGESGHPAVDDGYGRPIVLQYPDPDRDAVISGADLRHARLVSAGEDGRIDTPVDAHFPSRGACKDDLVLYVSVADLRPE